jgi:hypothetical protein
LLGKIALSNFNKHTMRNGVVELPPQAVRGRMRNKSAWPTLRFASVDSAATIMNLFISFKNTTRVFICVAPMIAIV